MSFLLLLEATLRVVSLTSTERGQPLSESNGVSILGDPRQEACFSLRSRRDQMTEIFHVLEPKSREPFVRLEPDVNGTLVLYLCLCLLSSDSFGLVLLLSIASHHPLLLLHRSG